MKQTNTRAIALALTLALAPLGAALAGDENVTATGDIRWAEDANQGTGTQTNADDWADMDNALAGSGAQNVETQGDANTGTGTQNNTETFQDRWYDIDNANTGTGAQVLSTFDGPQLTTNSNGGERISDDIVMVFGNASSLGSSDLEAAVSGNSVAVAGDSGGADAQMSIYGDSRFSGLSGVSAIALGSGGNASQNVSVNVAADVRAE